MTDERPSRGSIDQAAEAVSDGRPPDWAALRECAAGKESLGAFRIIAAVAAAHRQSAGQAQIPTRSLRVLEQVGTGSFGTVYRAYDPDLDREVALKILDSTRAGARIVEEGRLLARVRHPNVVTVYAVENIDGRPALSMEFVSGTTLERAVGTKGPLSEAATISVARTLCSALAAVHGRGLVHGDVKAQNVMQEPAGRLVLMDMGAAWDTGNAPLDKAIAGTPLYAAPEVLAGDSPSIQSDIYSLGVLLYYLLSGTFPVSGALERIRAGHDSDVYQRLVEVAPGISDALARVIERALSRDPDDRFQTATDFGAALLALPGPDRTRVRSWRRRMGVVSVAIAGSVLGVCALLIPRLASGRGATMGRVTTAQPQAAVRTHVPPAAAQDLYQRARQLWGTRRRPDLLAAVPLFEQAVRLDPQFAEAYAGLANAYTLLNVYGVLPKNEMEPKAKAAALQAIHLDPTLSQAYTALGYALIEELDWPGGETAYKRAIQLDPTDPLAHHWYALTIARLRGEEAIAEIERAHQLDPQSRAIEIDVGVVYMRAWRIDQAIAHLSKTVAKYPDAVDARLDLGEAYYWRDRLPEATAQFEDVLAVDPGNNGALVWLGACYGRAGRASDAALRLRRAHELAKHRYVREDAMASLAVARGQPG